MNVSAILDTARILTNTNDQQISDTIGLSLLNLVKDDFWGDIVVGVNEDYGWDYWKTNKTVINQTEYVIPEALSDSTGVYKLKALSISYDGSTYDNGDIKYERAKEVSLAGLPYSWEYYTKNQPKEDPIFYISDNSVFIAPYPDVAVTDGIKLNGIRNLVDYTIATTESETGIPAQYHNILVEGLVSYIFRRLRNTNEYISAQQQYEKLKSQALDKISDRNQGPFTAQYPYEQNGYNYPRIYTN